MSLTPIVFVLEKPEHEALKGKLRNMLSVINGGLCGPREFNEFSNTLLTHYCTDDEKRQLLVAVLLEQLHPCSYKLHR